VPTVAVYAQSLLTDPAFVASLNPPQPIVASGFYPTNVANTVAFWNYRDLPAGAVNAWTDEVSGLVLTNWTPAWPAPTNTAMGLYFFGCGLTNETAFSTPANFSIWTSFASTRTPAISYQLYGSMRGTAKLEINSNRELDGYWGADNAWTGHYFGGILDAATPSPGAVTNPPLWNDIVDSQGKVFLNGASTPGNIGEPTGSVTWQAMGNSADFSGNQALLGYIKYMLLSTNHAITATEASNLWVWEMTNGVTNVSGGCVAWWKMADASNSTTIADSSGGGWTGTLVGRPRPVWTNGLNAIVSQALNFDGVQNVVNIPITGSFITSSNISASLWLKFTNGVSNGSFIIGYADATFATGQDWGIFCDGPFNEFGAVRGGLNNASADLLESSAPGLADGNWHHFVFASDGSNIFDWFDGIRDLGGPYGTGAPQNASGVYPMVWNVGLTNIQMGGVWNSNHQPCTITDVRIYDRILSDAEVDILYRSPTADQIVGAYNF
jgi:hypothetical protein